MASSQLAPLLPEALRLSGPALRCLGLHITLGKIHLGHNYLQCCNSQLDTYSETNVLRYYIVTGMQSLILAGTTRCTWDTVTYLATMVHTEATARRLTSSHYYWLTDWVLASPLRGVLLLRFRVHRHFAVTVLAMQVEQLDGTQPRTLQRLLRTLKDANCCMDFGALRCSCLQLASRLVALSALC